MKREKVEELLKQGKPIKEIAKEVPCTVRYVKKIIAMSAPKEEVKKEEPVQEVPQAVELKPPEPPKEETKIASEFVVDSSGSKEMQFNQFAEQKPPEDKSEVALQKTRENVANLFTTFYCSTINALSEKEVVKRAEREMIYDNTLGVCQFYITGETQDKHVALGLFALALIGVGIAHWQDIQPGIQRLQGKRKGEPAQPRQEVKQEAPPPQVSPPPQEEKKQESAAFGIDPSQYDIPLPP